MRKKIKKYKVGIDSETYAISMVDSPAIESDFVALKKEEEQMVFLEKEEKHMVYGAVLIPDKDIYRCNHNKDVEISNTEQEFYISFTKESIEKMSQDFFKDYRQHNVTLDHETDATDITVVESWLKADDIYDKSVALGLDKTLPIGTWFIGMKVNQVDVWNRIKNGELKGFSVESMISLEEFEKQNKDNMIETNENFWIKMKNVLSEAFKSASMIEKDQLSNDEEVVNEELNEETPSEPAPEPAPQEPQRDNKSIIDKILALINGGDVKNVVETAKEVEKPTEVAPEEPKEEEVKNTPEPEQEPVTEPETKPEPQPNPLEDVVKNLRAEIEELKKNNEALVTKIGEISKEPSAKPINTNAGNGAAPTEGVNNPAFQAWRDKMRQMS